MWKLLCFLSQGCCSKQCDEYRCFVVPDIYEGISKVGAGTAWLSLRLDVMGLTVLTAAGLLAVASRIPPSLAGFSLIYALDLTKFLKFGTRIASKTETDFNSVERVAQYLQVQPPSYAPSRAVCLLSVSYRAVYSAVRMSCQPAAKTVVVVHSLQR